MAAAPQALQVTTAVLAAIGLAVWFAWARRNRQQWRYAVPPVTWLLHVLVFYVSLFLWGFSEPGLFVFWSAVLRLHAGFLLAGIGVVMYAERIIVKPSS